MPSYSGPEKSNVTSIKVNEGILKTETEREKEKELAANCCSPGGFDSAKRQQL